MKFFNKIGIIPKTVTHTKKGTKTEDTKLCIIDFTELADENINFQDSSVFNYLNNQHFLLIVFEEPASFSKLLENKFVGFKRLIFPDRLIENDVRKVWNEVRDLINTNELKETIKCDKNGNAIKNKKTGKLKTSINFPKSKGNNFFLKGTGSDSNKKPLVVNGISMYRQNLWIRGETLVTILNEMDFI
ncbi:hypothetical protein RFW18_02990 [Metabacillus idriensis]|uniref:hypothetical protein n=1 Tax=Metabacillus idriensis TaxID=324768 RepID=UPI0028137991|nr:hypothetical protein [Metabacillus idriensis]MDR0136696.1 hypothetical protein [Metabacillus idriensis]